MAITINVGGSKKVSQNYDSQGVSLNVTAEVPNDALADPQKIADTANDLFELVNGLLNEQITKLSKTDTLSRPGSTYRPTSRYPASNRGRSNGHTTASRNGNGNGRHRERSLTQAQERAIITMTRRLEEDADTLAHREFGANRVADLTVRQASEFIDILKSELNERKPQEVGR